VLPDGGESLPQNEVLAIDKAIAEGTPAERLIVLGWMINTRRLLISLPTNKVTAWTANINDSLLSKGRRVKLRTLETMVGRLQHVANIMVQGNHFLGRLRSAVLRANKFKGTRLSSEETKDLVLWKDFLVVAHTGINLNLLTTREPNNILRTDACEHGLGGYSLKTGRAWRWEIPLHLRGRKSINFLEFLACVVGIMLSIEEDDPAAGYCYLSATNNTSAMGWLRKSNFVSDDDHAAHLGLAQEFPSELLRRALMNYSQWFAGEGNWVADLLSRDLVSSADHEITTIINSRFPSQVLKSFKVSPLPAEISSFLSYWVQLQTLPRGSPAKRTAKPTPSGNSESSSSSRQTSSTPTAKATPTSAPWSDPKPTAPSVPLPTPSGCAITANPQKDMLNWLRVLHAVPPSTMWLRPSSQQTSPTPDFTLTERLRSFYFNSSRDTRTTTPANKVSSAYPSPS
jgi:hypothetical protein